MEFTILEKELLGSGVCRILQNNVVTPELFLNKLEFYTPNNTHFSSNTIYICEQIPEQIPDINHFNFIIFNSVDLPKNEKTIYNYLHLSTETKKELIEFLEVLFEDDKRLMHAIQPMLETLLRGRGLQKLNDAATQILGNPFWITDMNFKFLTLPSVADPVILEGIQLGHVTNDIIHYLREMHIPEKALRINEAFCFPASNRDRKVLIAPVKIQNTIVGYINLEDENYPFSTYDFRLMNKIAEIISLELQKDSYFRLNKGISFSYFLTDLLNEQIIDPINIKKRLHILGYNSKKYFYILTIDLRNKEFRETNTHFITEQIKFILKDCIYCNFKGNLVFLYTTNADLCIDGYIHRQLEQYFSGNNLKCGISQRFSDLSTTKYYYDQTMVAIDLGQQLNEQVQIHYYYRYVTYHLYKETCKQVSYSALGHHTIDTLLEYDAVNQTDLFETLKHYLKCNLQIVKTADVMGLHSNTLRYRIAKIKEITGVAFEDGDETLELMLALKMYSYKELEKTNE